MSNASLATHSRPWLLIDVSAYAYRAVYALNDLSHDGVSTGVAFHLFRTVLDLQELHHTDRVVWCFDGGYGKRLELRRSYKQQRREEDSEEMREARNTVREQLIRLRVDYLPAVGYANVCYHKGYEADDVIASICDTLPRDQQAIIASGDNDLWQLLRPNVCIWQSKEKVLTAQKFTEEWGISPCQWADVKAMAGCSTDNVVGIRGIGPKTAAKFLTGKLKPTSKAFQSIVANNATWKGNDPLVRLPFPGVKQFTLMDDRELCWGPTLAELGIKSLDGRVRR